MDRADAVNEMVNVDASDTLDKTNGSAAGMTIANLPPPKSHKHEDTREPEELSEIGSAYSDISENNQRLYFAIANPAKVKFDDAKTIDKKTKIPSARVPKGQAKYGNQHDNIVVAFPKPKPGAKVTEKAKTPSVPTPKGKKVSTRPATVDVLPQITQRQDEVVTNAPRSLQPLPSTSDLITVDHVAQDNMGNVDNVSESATVPENGPADFGDRIDGMNGLGGLQQDGFPLFDDTNAFVPVQDDYDGDDQAIDFGIMGNIGNDSNSNNIVNNDPFSQQVTGALSEYDNSMQGFGDQQDMPQDQNYQGFNPLPAQPTSSEWEQQEKDFEALRNQQLEQQYQQHGHQGEQDMQGGHSGQNGQNGQSGQGAHNVDHDVHHVTSMSDFDRRDDRDRRDYNDSNRLEESLAEEREKQALLLELNRLSGMGVKLTRDFTMKDRLSDIQYEYERHNMNMEAVSGTSMIKDGLKFLATLVHIGNDKLGPFLDLKGFVESFCKSIDQQDAAVQGLYRKYWKKSNSSPEMTILFTFVGALLMTHAKNRYGSTFFKGGSKDKPKPNKQTTPSRDLPYAPPSQQNPYENYGPYGAPPFAPPHGPHYPYNPHGPQGPYSGQYNPYPYNPHNPSYATPHYYGGPYNSFNPYNPQSVYGQAAPSFGYYQSQWPKTQGNQGQGYPQQGYQHGYPHGQGYGVPPPNTSYRPSSQHPGHHSQYSQPPQNQQRQQGPQMPQSPHYQDTQGPRDPRQSPYQQDTQGLRQSPMPQDLQHRYVQQSQDQRQSPIPQGQQYMQRPPSQPSTPKDTPQKKKRRTMQDLE